MIQLLDSAVTMDLEDVFQNFKIHLKDNVYAVLWSAWLRKDKSGLSEHQCQHILHTFVHAFFILASLQRNHPNDLRLFFELVDEIRNLIE